MNAVDDFRKTLQQLKANNKSEINLLTILADDYRDVAHAIVEAIDGHLHNVIQEQKLPTMYLTDSIIKNVPRPYKSLFENTIVKMFLHCFKSGNEPVRAALHRLRLTWTNIFSRSKLDELDRKVNREDPNWPITPPVVRPAAVPPPPAPAPISAPVVPPSTSSNQKVHVNPKFVGRMASKKDGAPCSSSSSSATVSTSNEVPMEVKSILKKPGGSVRDPRAVKDRPAAKTKEKEDIVTNVKTQPVDEPMQTNSSAPETSTKKNVKVEDVNQIPIHKDETKDERRKRSGEEMKSNGKEGSDGSPPPKNFRRFPPRQANQRQQRPVGAMVVPPNGSVSSVPRHSVPASVAAPTNVAGAHAFSMAPRTQPSPPIASGGVMQPPIMTYPRVSTPPSLPPHPPHPSHPQQFVPGLLNPMLAAANPFGPNLGMPPPPMGAAPFMLPPNMQRPPQRTHVFRDENRLEGIPANNRIFVEGKAYEVLFIRETAVIEKDGLPHRIYFQGEPRNVVIDGIAHMLSFGETREVAIDGEVHKIRFGAPSRELYMGDYPFKGAFGGPPVMATINGRRHEIRLTGRAPEVKIEPEPTYELSRFLAQARMESQQQMNPRPAPPPAVAAPVKVELKADLNALLTKLKTSGIMNILGTIKNEGYNRVDSPPALPVVSDIRAGSDRAVAPLPLFEKEPFDMRLLKTRYDSVVVALLAKRSVCEQCGLRFESTSGSKYEKHLDWHVRRNLAAAKTKGIKSRGWYCSRENWVKAKDTAEDEYNGQGVDPLAKVAAATAQNARNEEEERRPSMNSDEALSKASGDRSLIIITCEVCGEDFEEYYDEDSDKWKLRDCVKKGGQMCHEKCVPDAIVMEDVGIETEIKEEEEEEEEEKPFLSKMTIRMDPRLKSTQMA